MALVVVVVVLVMLAPGERRKTGESRTEFVEQRQETMMIAGQVIS